MVIIILFIVATIEIAFAVYCISSRSNQARTGSFIHIGLFTIFIVFASVSNINWNFQWTALTMLLFFWTALGALTLVRNKEDKREYKRGRSIRRAICSIFLIAIVLIPAFLFPEYELIQTTGEFTVTTVLYTYIDENRVETYTETGENRKLNVEFWYPDEMDEVFPLIVFSHGAFGIRTSNESLYHELASHGYVVASIDHTYHALFTTDADGNRTWIDLGYMREVNAQDAHSSKQQSFEYFQKWMGIRKGDINFVIDYILVQDDGDETDSVYRHVDKEKIGVMGHSLGGSAALGIGRSRDNIGAVIAIESPFLTIFMG